MSLQEAVKSKVGKMVAGSTAPILVIGGGLSAAQAAIAAHRAGAAVVLRSRRKLMTKCVQMFLSFYRVLHLPLLVFHVCFRAGSWLIRELDPSQNPQKCFYQQNRFAAQSMPCHHSSFLSNCTVAACLVFLYKYIVSFFFSDVNSYCMLLCVPIFPSPPPHLPLRPPIFEHKGRLIWRTSGCNLE